MYKNTVVCAPTDGKQKEQESYLIIENGRIILFYVITSFPIAYKYVHDLKSFFLVCIMWLSEAAYQITFYFHILSSTYAHE